MGVLVKRGEEYVGFSLCSKKDEGTMQGHFMKCIDNERGSRFYVMKSCIDTIGARYRYKKTVRIIYVIKNRRYSKRSIPRRPIDKRMARFEEWLSNQEWKPKVITLCRSAISGYLPSDYSQYVEEQLLECLERIYSIKKEKIERKS